MNDDKLKRLESLLRDHTDMYFYTIQIDAKIINDAIRRIRNNNLDPMKLIDDLITFYERKQHGTKD